MRFQTLPSMHAQNASIQTTAGHGQHHPDHLLAAPEMSDPNTAPEMPDPLAFSTGDPESESDALVTGLLDDGVDGVLEADAGLYPTVELQRWNIRGAVGFDTAGLVNGADGGTVDGVVTAGLVTGTFGEEVEGVGSGYVTGTGVVEEGGLVEGAVMGVGRGFKEGIVMVGFVEGTVMIVGVGFVEGTVIGGVVGLVT
ncbi:hypothetical protein EJB05_29761, partial [Eragrostis curvula]